MDALRMWNHLMSESTPPSKEALALYGRACDLESAGAWGQARELLLGCVGELEDHNSPAAAAANLKLAVLLQEEGDRDGAVFHCVRSLFLYNRFEDAGGLYAGLRNLIVIHRSRGENRLAMAAQHQAARVREVLRREGTLEAAEDGRDRVGQVLPLLRIISARMPEEASEAV